MSPLQAGRAGKPVLLGTLPFVACPRYLDGGRGRNKEIIQFGWRGVPDIALDVWVTQDREGLKGERHLHSLLLFHNPDAQSSVLPTCFLGKARRARTGTTGNNNTKSS